MKLLTIISEVRKDNRGSEKVSKQKIKCIICGKEIKLDMSTVVNMCKKCRRNHKPEITSAVLDYDIFS